jgi:hypothetical protein
MFRRLRRRRPTPPESPARAGRPPPPPSPDRFRGVRIFDISDISNPKQVAAVQSCRGSHTHTLVIDPKDKDNVYIYISGTGAFVRRKNWRAARAAIPDANPDTALFRIDIIKVPLAHPGAGEDRVPARASSPMRKPAPSTASGRAATTAKARRPPRHQQVPRHHGLFGHRPGGGACSGNGILLDIPTR